MDSLSLVLAVVVVLLAAAGTLTRRVTLGGAVSGALIGIATVAGFSWHGLALLLLYFPVLSGGATRFRWQFKRERGLLDETGGRDGAQALANGAVPGLAAALTFTGVLPPALGWSLFITGLTLSLADTVSAEVGKGFAGATRLITDFSRVEPGTDGGVSIEGTLAGLLAGGLMVLSGALLSPPGAELHLAPVIIGSVTGIYLDSLLGATQQGGLETLTNSKFANDLVNLSASAGGTAVALALVTAIS